ncbi:hypothetical protein K461DRAFT_84630 [Myriangium duriaei CBS 260.36]|uniref:Uncharacterized protein n=1 Tax=Myriangium duriaei CBS 260.36 TaxID=1168546 RepID=A0A9P4JA52_9PEZI|nr:hypothetical protein K461DRAFT_84630 [Myriangium duriaei CBS 260.36]
MATALQPRLHLNVDSRHRPGDSQDVSPISPLHTLSERNSPSIPRRASSAGRASSANPSTRSGHSNATSSTSSTTTTATTKKKKHGSMMNFFTLKDPSTKAFDKLAAQHKEQQALNATRSPSIVGTFGVSSQKLPSNVPKTNSKWDGLPQASRNNPRNSQDKPRHSHERKDSLWSAIKRRPSNAASRSSVGSLKTASTQDNSPRPSTTVSPDDKALSMPNRTVSPVLESDCLPAIEPLSSLADDLIPPSPAVSSLDQSVITDPGVAKAQERQTLQPLQIDKSHTSAAQVSPTSPQPTTRAEDHSQSATDSETSQTRFYDDTDDELYSKSPSSEKPHDSPLQLNHKDFQAHQTTAQDDAPHGKPKLLSTPPSSQELAPSAPCIDHQERITRADGPSSDHTSFEGRSDRRPSWDRIRHDSDEGIALVQAKGPYLSNSSHSRSPSTSTVFIAPAKVSEQYTRSLHSSHAPSNSHSQPRSRSRSTTPPARPLHSSAGPEPAPSAAYAAHSRQVSNSTVTSHALSLLPGEASPKLMQAATVQVQPAPVTHIDYVRPARHSHIAARPNTAQPLPLRDTTRPSRTKNFSKPFNTTPNSPNQVSTPLSAASDGFPVIQPLAQRRDFHRRLSSGEVLPGLHDDDTEIAKNYALSVGFWETATAAAASRGRVLSDPGPIPVADDNDTIPFSSRLEGPFDPASALF